MSELLSALEGRIFRGFVDVADAGLRGMITLRGDLEDSRFADAVVSVAGCVVPDRMRISGAGERGLCWMSPDELMLLCRYEETRTRLDELGNVLSGLHHLAADVSDARAVLRIDGARVREVLAKLTPVDLNAAVFGPGDFRRTRLAQAAAAFWMPDEESAEIFCFRSVADYVFAALENASAPGGEVDGL